MTELPGDRCTTPTPGPDGSPGAQPAAGENEPDAAGAPGPAEPPAEPGTESPGAQPAAGENEPDAAGAPGPAEPPAEPGTESPGAQPAAGENEPDAAGAPGPAEPPAEPGTESPGAQPVAGENEPDAAGAPGPAEPPAEPGTESPAELTSEAALPPVAPGHYPLPTARQVVSQGLELLLVAGPALRGASLYFGLLFVLILGPVLVVVLADLAVMPAFLDALSVAEPMSDEVLGRLMPMFVILLLAMIPVLAVSVDMEGTAAALLASWHVGRPMPLREAIGRSRQVFWRLVGATIVVGVVSLVVQWIVSQAIAISSESSSEAGTLFLSAVSALVLAPFGYFIAGIVLGDVGAMVAVGRSVRLARTRPSLALVIAAFALVVSAIQIFAMGAGADLVARLFETLHLRVDSGPGGFTGVLVVGLALLSAFGSLVLTVSAILIAPQVIAFVGLTHYHAGLDRARDPGPFALDVAAASPTSASPTRGVIADPLPLDDTSDTSGQLMDASAPATSPPSAWFAPEKPRARRFRWVTIPMAVLIGLEWLMAVGAIADVAGRG